MEETRDFLRFLLMIASPGLMLCGFGVLYLWLSRPLRKQEESRMFINLLQMAAGRGRSPEEAIIEASRTRDPALPVWVHYFAAHLEAGFGLAQTVQLCQGVVPAQVARMLEIGLKNGALPELLKRAEDLQFASRSRSFHGMELLYLGFLSFLPAISLICHVLITFVIPKYEALVDAMGGSPAYVQSLRSYCEMASLFALLTALLVLALGLRYSGLLPPLPRLLRKPIDAALLRLSYIRTRAVRHFATALGLFLDCNISEKAAVLQAAEMTGNLGFLSVAQSAADDLERGVSLPKALLRFNHIEQVASRCDFAAASRLPFQKALTGWLDYLKAKESQQEQSFYHFFSSAVTVVNGVMIGLLAYNFFGALISIIESQ